MIITETFTVHDKEFIRTYSDKGVKVHGGFPEADYAEAVDPAELERVYTETNIPIEENDEPTAEELLSILTGETE